MNLLALGFIVILTPTLYTFTYSASAVPVSNYKSTSPQLQTDQSITSPYVKVTEKNDTTTGSNTSPSPHETILNSGNGGHGGNGGGSFFDNGGAGGHGGNGKFTGHGGNGGDGGGSFFGNGGAGGTGGGAQLGQPGNGGHGGNSLFGHGGNGGNASCISTKCGTPGHAGCGLMGCGKNGFLVTTQPEVNTRLTAAKY